MCKVSLRITVALTTTDTISGTCCYVVLYAIGKTQHQYVHSSKFYYCKLHHITSYLLVLYTQIRSSFLLLIIIVGVRDIRMALINLLNPTGHVMHQQVNIQQLYVLPTLYLCVLYLSENKQRLVPLTP